MAVLEVGEGLRVVASSTDAELVKVEAVLREEHLDAVIQRLVLIGIRGLTLMPVKVSGHTARRAVFRGQKYDVPFISRVALEWVGPRAESSGVARAIAHAARKAGAEEGDVTLTVVEDALRVRTGERGEDAL